MNDRSFTYMLRFGMVPGWHEDERLEQLLRFCLDTGTTDVMFFYNCEELNRGHYTPEELELWLDLIGRIKPILAAERIRTSINPWTTTLHTDRGRKLRPGQDFRRMVDPCGREADAVGCPLDPSFLKYIDWQYSTCVTKVGPDVLWVEDDFRLHNHHPLNWGGCFCSEHMHRFQEAAGHPLTRESFVRGILEPGAVHPYRQVWLDVARQTMVGLAQTIGDAVRRADPGVRLGLMTSDPVTHSAEGRDWEAVCKALTTDRDPIIRIHLPSYQETGSRQYGVAFALVSRLTRHFAPSRMINYGELENFTFSRLSKSLAFSRMQIETNALLDSRGVTLDIFDMMGNGILPGDGWTEMLAKARPFLDRLVELGFDQARQSGVQVMVDDGAAAHLQTTAGTAMNELYARERGWMEILVPFSIATRYTSDPAVNGQVVAVSGQYLRNISAVETRRLLAENFVMLDGEAILTLSDRGLADLAGIADVKRIPMHSGVCAYEQIADGGRDCDIAEARMTMQVGAGDFVRLTYRQEAQVHIYSRAYSPFDVDQGPAMTLVNDRLFLLPYVQPQAAILNPYRRSVLMRALAQAGTYRQPTSAADPHLSLIRYDWPDRTLICVVNLSGDDLDMIRLNVPEWTGDNRNVRLYVRSAPDGVERTISRIDGDWLLDEHLPHLQMLVVEEKHPDRDVYSNKLIS